MNGQTLGSPLLGSALPTELADSARLGTETLTAEDIVFPKGELEIPIADPETDLSSDKIAELTPIAELPSLIQGLETELTDGAALDAPIAEIRLTETKPDQGAPIADTLDIDLAEDTPKPALDVPIAEVMTTGEKAGLVPIAETPELTAQTGSAAQNEARRATTLQADLRLSPSMIQAQTASPDSPAPARPQVAPQGEIDTTQINTPQADNPDSDTLDLRKADSDTKIDALIDDRRTEKSLTTEASSRIPATGVEAAKAQTASPVLIPTQGAPSVTGPASTSLTNSPATVPTAIPVSLDRIPQTVVAVTLTNDRATLQIDPPELGRIQLDYQFDSQGRTVVTLVPETEAGRAVLVDRITAITTALQQSVSGAVDVMIGDANDFAAGDGQAFTGGDSESGDEPGAAGQAARDGHAGSQSPDGPLYTIDRPVGGSGRLHIRV